MKEENEEFFYTPIFEKDGNKFAVCNWLAKTEEEAFQIAVGAIIEGVLLGFTYTKEVKKVYENADLPYAPATLGHLTVAIFEGPFFNEAMRQKDETC